MEAEQDFQHTAIRVCYLDHAKEATLSQSVRLAGFEAILMRPWNDSSSRDKQYIRRLFASLIGASPEDIAITASTAFAISLAAANIARLRENGGKIVVLQDEMCSEIYAWQRVVHLNPKFQLEVVDCSPDDMSDEVLRRLDNTVAVVAIPTLHWSHGSLLDLEAISKSCSELDIDLIVDGTQSIGILPINVAHINPTLVACSVQKWLRCPPGLSLVYVNRRVHEAWHPLDQHGRGRKFSKTDWNAYPNQMGPHGYPEEFFPDARKFDGGGTLNQILLSMIHASLKEVCALDIDSVQAKLKTLMLPLLDWANEHNMFVPRCHAYHLVGLRPNNFSVEAMLNVCGQLKSSGIHISVRNGFYRISPYIMNTPEDIDRLILGFQTRMVHEC